MYNYPKLDEARKRSKALGLPMPYSSQRKNKKLYVVYHGRQIHFGDRRYSDFLQHEKTQLLRLKHFVVNKFIQLSMASVVTV